MKTVSTKDAPAAIGPYSQAIISGNFVFATKENASILDDTNIVIRNTDGKDYKWKLSEQEAGTYTITINFNTNKISFEKQN